MPHQGDGEDSAQRAVMNKAIVIDATKAACLVRCWTSTWPGHASATGSPRSDTFEAELEACLEDWQLVEFISSPEILRYDQLNGIEDAFRISQALAVTMLLSSDKDEYLEIRRELQKIACWIETRYDIDTHGLPHSLQQDNRMNPCYEDLQAIVRYLPELKQGWNEARAEGVQDYLTVLSLRLNSGSSKA